MNQHFPPQFCRCFSVGPYSTIPFRPGFLPGYSYACLSGSTPIATLCCVYSPYRHRVGRCSSPAVATQLALLARPLCSLTCWLPPVFISARSELPACLFVRWAPHLTNSNPPPASAVNRRTTRLLTFFVERISRRKTTKMSWKDIFAHGFGHPWAGVGVRARPEPPNCHIVTIGGTGDGSPHSTQQKPPSICPFLPPHGSASVPYDSR